tara:strand:- start:56 stop:499 length:444 start_codon:yes stop_codon:yes gene_type:complete
MATQTSRMPEPLIISGKVERDGKPVAKAVVSVLNASGEPLGNPKTKKAITSISGPDGVYEIIYGFNNKATGQTLVVTTTSEDAKKDEDKTLKQSFIINPEEGMQDLVLDKLSGGWLAKNKMYVIFGGVAVLGLITTLIILKRNKSKK